MADRTGSDSSNRRQSLGRRGEQLAADFLRRHGYQVHETNFRCRYGEIDIVASEGDTLVFVEVRTRSGSAFGTAAESVTPRKQRKLRQVAEAYLQARYGEAERKKTTARAPAPSTPPAPIPTRRPGDLPSCRIDVVVLAMNGHGVLQAIDLIRGAVSE